MTSEACCRNRNVYVLIGPTGVRYLTTPSAVKRFVVQCAPSGRKAQEWVRKLEMWDGEEDLELSDGEGQPQLPAIVIKRGRLES